MLATLFHSCCGLVRKGPDASGAASKRLLSSTSEEIAAAYERSRNRDKHVVLEAAVTQNKRLVLIGDVHGCAAELDQLLEKVDFKRDGSDIAVFVGDLVAKGPDSRRVVQRAMELDAYGVRGNHDHYVIRNYYEQSGHDGREHSLLANGGLDPRQIEWLGQLPMSLKIQEHNLLVVHAGLLPELKVQNHSDDDLMHMRNTIPNDDGTFTATSDPKTGKPWVELYHGPEHVVFGHDAKRKLQKTQNATGLDTGCVYGGCLSALVVPGYQILSVDANETYVQPGSKPLSNL